MILDITAWGHVQSGFLFLFSSIVQEKKHSPQHGPFHPLSFLGKSKLKEKDKAVWQKDISLAEEEQSELELLVQMERLTTWFLALLLLVWPGISHPVPQDVDSHQQDGNIMLMWGCELM